MDIPNLLLKGGDEVYSEITKNRKSRDVVTYLKQYNPDDHDIHDKTKRLDKIIVTTENGSEVTKNQAVARISVPFQQIIVDRAATFLIGEGIGITAETETDQEDTLLAMVRHIWSDTKMDYRSRELARIWMSETECAELWYFVEKPDLWEGFGLAKGGGKLSIKCRILANSYGDTLYPHFNDQGDMDAFGHAYTVNKDQYFDVYTAETINKYKLSGGWKLDLSEKNLLGKIPVVYYDRLLPEWAAVQPMIDRYETMISNLADNNDYFANPMIVVKGEVQGFASKGEQGKIITTTGDATVNYLTWDQAPVATVFEKDLLQEMIFAGTQTPDISFAKMQNIGAASGVALRMMFMDAKLKTLKHQETYGECVQRRINIIKKGCSLISTSVEVAQSLQIEPIFEFYLPTNDMELIQMLTMSTGGKAIMSQETAVENNPFVTNTTIELEKIKADKDQEFRFNPNEDQNE